MMMMSSVVSLITDIKYHHSPRYQCRAVKISLTQSYAPHYIAGDVGVRQPSPRIPRTPDRAAPRIIVNVFHITDHILANESY